MSFLYNKLDRPYLVAGFNLLAIASGFYLTQILPLSPIYFLLAVALVLSLYTIGLSKTVGRLKNRAITWVFIISSLHFFGYLLWVSPLNSAIGFYLNFVFLSLSWRLLPHLSSAVIDKALMRMIDFTILLGTCESLVRWLFPFQEYSDRLLRFIYSSGDRFYLYKYNSIMYQDSNFVAMWLLVVTLLATEYFGMRRAGKRSVILYALVVLTICRSAIIFLSSYLLLKLLNRFVPGSGLRVILYASLITIFLLLIYPLVNQDESFQSKITIFSAVSTSLSDVTRQNWIALIFGAGLDTSKITLGGVAAHNFFVEILMDTGLIGFVCVLFAMFYLVYLGGKPAYTIVVVFLLAGLSFAPLAIPYLFTILSALAFSKASRIGANGVRAHTQFAT